MTEVRNAFKNLAKVKAVRAEITAQQIGANGQVANSVFKYDFVPPDRYQLTSSTGGISRVVNGDLYSFANNVWTKLPEYSGKDYEGFDHFFNPKFMDGLAEEIGTTATVEKKATDTINGKTCQAYVLTVVSTGNTTDVCIADNYPLRSCTTRASSTRRQCSATSTATSWWTSRRCSSDLSGVMQG